MPIVTVNTNVPGKSIPVFFQAALTNIMYKALQKPREVSTVFSVRLLLFVFLWMCVSHVFGVSVCVCVCVCVCVHVCAEYVCTCVSVCVCVCTDLSARACMY